MPSYGLNPGLGATARRTPRYQWPSGGGTNSGQYQPRGFPESIDLNNVNVGGQNHNVAMEAIGAVAKAPGYVYDRPLALFGELAKGLADMNLPGISDVARTLDSDAMKGIGDFVGGIPFIGDLTRAGGEVLEADAKVFPAAANARTVQQLKAAAGLPNDAPWQDYDRLIHATNPLSMLGGMVEGNPTRTVGDLRQDAMDRGFTAQDIADIEAGRKGLFDFGGTNANGMPYATNANPLIDVAGRITLDPLNAAVVLGPAKVLGALEKVPGAAKVLGLGKARAIVRADPVLKAALDAPVKGVRAGVDSLSKGITEGVGNKSIGLFLMGMSKGGGALLGEYRKAALLTTGGQLSVNAIDYALHGDEAPTGPFSDLFKAGRAMRDSTPLSGGMLFSLWAATHFPVMPTVRGVTSPVYTRIRERFPKYADIEAKMVDLTLRGTDTSGMTYAQKLTRAKEIAGGNDRWWAFIDMMGTKHHADLIPDVELSMNPVSNMAELQANVSLAGDLTATRMRANPNEFDGRAAVATAIDWSTGARMTSTPWLRKAMGGLRSTFDPQRMWDQFGQWLSVAKQISLAFAGAPPVVPALRKTLIKEHIQVLRHQMWEIQKAHGGVIPAGEATRLLLDHPSLLNHETGGFWARALIRDGQDIKWEWARQRLKAAEKDAYSLREVIGDSNFQKRYGREAETRRNIRRPDGSVDPTLLGGSARIHVQTAEDTARADAMTLPDRLNDALSARTAAAGLGVLDNDTVFALRDAGYKITSSKDGISIRDGALAPGKEIIIDASMGPQAAAEVAALALRRAGSTSPARLIYTGLARELHHLKANTIQLRWDLGAMDDLQRQTAVSEMNAIFDGAWFDDTTGTLYALAEKGGDIAGRYDRASRSMGALFPDRAPAGVLKPRVDRAWTQTIRDTGRSQSGRAARAAGTERSVADVARHAKGRSTNWHMAQSELAGVDQRRLGGLAGQPGRDTGPVGQPGPDGAGVSPDLDRGQVGTPVGFHGSNRRITQLDPGGTQTHPGHNLFGNGLYVTDNPTVARSYTTKGGRKGESTLHDVQWVGDHEPRLIDADGVEFPKDLKQELAEALDASGHGDIAGAMFEEPMPLSLGQIYDRIRNEVDGLPTEEAADVIDQLTFFLQGKGFDGIRYKGGVRTGHQEHTPVVYFDTDNLSISPRPTGNTGQVDFVLDPVAEATQFQPNFGNTHGSKAPELDDEGNIIPSEEAPDLNDGIAEKIIPGSDDFEKAAINGLQEDLTRYDPTYTLEVAPRGATPYRIGEHPFADMVIGKQAAGDSWSQRVGSPLSQGLNVLFGPVHTARLQDEMKQELMNDLVTAGATPKEVQGFLAALDEASQKIDILFGHRRSGRSDQLDPVAIRNIAMGKDAGGVQVIPGFDGFRPEVLKKLGGADKVPEALGKSASRIFRRIEQANRARDGKGTMGKLLNEFYGGPAQAGFRGDKGKYLGYLRAFYPLIRFRLSPRWYLMNWFEGKIIGAVRYGGQATDEITRGDARAMSRFGGPQMDKDATAGGWFDDREGMTSIMSSSFRNERIDSAQTVVENMMADSPELAMLRKRVGDDATPRQMAEELDRMMYDYDTKGVAKTIDDEAQRFLDDRDYRMLREAGVLQRLTDINRKQWEGIYNGFRGNVNRSNVERMLNSYFLFWPISYQLKVSKLLVDVLTNRMLGRQTDTLGAWTIDRLWQEHTDRLASDPKYRAMFEENPTLWTMAGMMLPIVPFDMGLSESRLTRYLQSNVGAALGLWGKDKGYPSDPLDMAARVANLGLPYDIDLLQKAGKEISE